MMYRLSKVLRRSDEILYAKNEADRRVRQIDSELLSSDKRLNKLSLARTALTEFAQQSQEEIKTSIEDLVTLALRSVFDREWSFKLYFERKRNDFTIRPVIVENGEEFDPKDELGGGAIDIISYALRVILFSLSDDANDYERVMILDEPMKFVGTGDTLSRAGSMIKEIAERLEIQTIMVTHDEELAEISDVAYEVTHNGTKSEINRTRPVITEASLIEPLRKALPKKKRKRVKL